MKILLRLRHRALLHQNCRNYYGSAFWRFAIRILKGKVNRDRLKAEKLQKEYDDTVYLAGTLTYDHQSDVRSAPIRKPKI
jgi:hypothetical protein